MESMVSGDECLRRCEMFTKITNTNNAIAMMFLQDTSWNLDEALSRFFESADCSPPKKARRLEKGASASSTKPPLLIDLTSEKEEGGAASGSTSAFAPAPNKEGEVIVLTDDDLESPPICRRRRKIPGREPQRKGTMQPTSSGTTSSTGVAEAMDVDVASPAAQPIVTFETTDRQHAHLFRVLSWNIDGLSTPSLHFRTPAVATLIENEKFHVVCLQEVVKESLSIIQSQLANLYDVFYPPDVQDRRYFPIICVVKQPGLVTVRDSFKMTIFPTSEMQRVLLQIDVLIDPTRLLPTNRLATVRRRPLRVRVWTSHLESCVESSEERTEQLRVSWTDMVASVGVANTSTHATNPNRPAYGIFCGDMNIREREIKALGGLPPGMLDVWQACGSRREAKATWDPRRNPNLSLDYPTGRGGAGYGMRFDRMYALGRGLRPLDFELRGIGRVPGHSHHPSDHWAILGHFDLTPA